MACAPNGRVETPTRAGERLLHGGRGGEQGKWLPSHAVLIYILVRHTPTDGWANCAHGNLCRYAANKGVLCVHPSIIGSLPTTSVWIFSS